MPSLERSFLFHLQLWVCFLDVLCLDSLPQLEGSLRQARKAVGQGRGRRPLYPSFPRDVVRISEWQLNGRQFLLTSLSHFCYSIGGGGTLYLFSICLSLHILQMKKHPWIHPFSQPVNIHQASICSWYNTPWLCTPRGRMLSLSSRTWSWVTSLYCFLKMCA